MNTYFLVAGCITILTGFVHMILGEKWIFSQLKPENLNTHYKGPVTKTTLRWFWHVGSFVVFFVGAVAIVMGTTDGVVPAEHFVGKLLAILYLGINSLLVLLHLGNPKGLKDYPQLIIMIVIMVLLYLGSEQAVPVV